MPPLSLTPSSTALVLIDLQRATLRRELAPYSGAQVVDNARRLVDTFRRAGGLIIFVRVNTSEFVQLEADAPPLSRPAGSPPPSPDDYELVDNVGFQTGDILITKKQWGAFYGTELDLQLRRHRITTIVLGGIATNFGVESTARAAAERAYQQVFVEDAMTTFSAEAHKFAVTAIFARLGRVRSTDEVLAAFAH